MRFRCLLVAIVAAVCLGGTVRAQQRAVPSGPTVAETLPIRIELDQRVRMRDGIELSADVYRPNTAGRYPCVLSRTPYNKNGEGSLKMGRYFAEHGYAFVAMDVRGRGDSDGAFVPYRNDGRDGYDAIEWCAAQPWSTGKVGTIGGSYNGKIQWLTAIEQPPHLAAMIAMVTPSDPFVEYPTGVPLPMDVSWYYFTWRHVLQNMAAVDWSSIVWHLPLKTMDDAINRPMPSWKEPFDHTQLDSWWEPERYQNKYDRVQVPVLHISGWYDDEQVGTPLNYIGMSTGGREGVRKEQKLLMGPWPHAINSKSKLGDVDFGSAAMIDLNDVWLRWFDAWLKGVDNGVKAEPPVRIFVMGDNRWVNEKEWPIARSQFTKYYLTSGGRANSLFGDGSLTTQLPGMEKIDSYTYDPAKPVPFITEPSFAQIGGPDDYRPVERRDDVLVYTSEAVRDDLEVCGPIKVVLYASSSASDTDFTAKLIDVWPDGFAQRLSDGIVRARFRNGMDRPELIESGKVYAYNINAWNTCEVFKRGHRVRLEISSSAFPKYDRNLNTGTPLGTTIDMKTAQQTVYHDAQHPSHVLLPIIPKAQ